jgi:hypothetical protein
LVFVERSDGVEIRELERLRSGGRVERVGVASRRMEIITSLKLESVKELREVKISGEIFVGRKSDREFVINHRREGRWEREEMRGDE